MSYIACGQCCLRKTIICWLHVEYHYDMEVDVDSLFVAIFFPRLSSITTGFSESLDPQLRPVAAWRAVPGLMRPVVRSSSHWQSRPKAGPKAGCVGVLAGVSTQVGAPWCLARKPGLVLRAVCRKADVQAWWKKAEDQKTRKFCGSVRFC